MAPTLSTWSLTATTVWHKLLSEMLLNAATRNLLDLVPARQDTSNCSEMGGLTILNISALTHFNRKRPLHHDKVLVSQLKCFAAMVARMRGTQSRENCTPHKARKVGSLRPPTAPKAPPKLWSEAVCQQKTVFVRGAEGAARLGAQRARKDSPVFFRMLATRDEKKGVRLNEKKGVRFLSNAGDSGVRPCWTPVFVEISRPWNSVPDVLELRKSALVAQRRLAV